MAELVVPALGESITEAVVAKWLKRVGEQVAADEPLVDLETDKVTVQLPAPGAGTIKEQRVAEGATVTVGQIIGVFEVGASAGAEPEAAEKKPQKSVPAAPQPAPAAPQPAPAAPVEVSPAPVEPAADAATRGMTPSQRKAVREGKAVAAAPPVAAPAAPAEPVVAGEGERVVPMSPLRKRIAERLVEAQQTAAILTTFNEIDMSAVMATRARFQDEFVARHGIKLGFMSFFIKACVAGLKRFPGVNAEVRGESIVYKERYHIGVAVGGGKGLVVPVVRDVDRLGFAEIEKTIADLAQRARDNKLVLDELMGGTFSISNGGIYGSMMSTPLLNMPQTGILGMHNIVKRPIAVGDAIEIRPMMYIALSYDHRVVDGREAVQFLVTVKDHIENPDRMLFDL